MRYVINDKQVNKLKAEDKCSARPQQAKRRRRRSEVRKQETARKKSKICLSGALEPMLTQAFPDLNPDPSKPQKRLNDPNIEDNKEPASKKSHKPSLCKQPKKGKDKQKQKKLELMIENKHLNRRVKELEEELKEALKRPVSVSWPADEIKELKKICEDNIATMNIAVEALSEQKLQCIEKAEHAELFERNLLKSREQELAQNWPESFPCMIGYDENQLKTSLLSDIGQTNFAYESPNYIEEEKGSTNSISVALGESFANVQGAVSCYVENIRKFNEYLSENTAFGRILTRR
eukprot:TRINITY_DN5236_c0_g2_i2.p1 TRINITY_DN5236_c0_g2~~TRINITY_DN5236_c0_g2_i2.p1  ORF type:complete len:292 (-),score=52.34 TRINITY_DN5236_c0_g2_i2:209-1084(-)